MFSIGNLCDRKSVWNSQTLNPVGFLTNASMPGNIQPFLFKQLKLKCFSCFIHVAIIKKRFFFFLWMSIHIRHFRPFTKSTAGIILLSLILLCSLFLTRMATAIRKVTQNFHPQLILFLNSKLFWQPLLWTLAFLTLHFNPLCSNSISFHFPDIPFAPSPIFTHW